MIAIIAGTKAELIKTLPVMKELKRRKIPYTLIHSGQHNIDDMLKQFGFRKADVVLTRPPEKSSKFFTKVHKGIFWLIFIIPKIRSALKKVPNLQWVIYHGDTMTTAAGAIASSRLLNPFKKYKNGHLESGLRSGRLMEPYPEEISRKIADFFSDAQFAVSDYSMRFLKHGINTGNTIVDVAPMALRMADKKKIKIPKGKFALVNTHRHENITSKERMEKVVQSIEAVPIKVHWPLHDNTRLQLEKFGLFERIQNNKNITITKLVDYPSFIYMISKCTILLTDGGSIQEESLIFKKPCFIMRYATERVEGLQSGINFLTKLDVEYTKKMLATVLSPGWRMPAFKNPYGEPGVSKRIVDYMTMSETTAKNLRYAEQYVQEVKKTKLPLLLDKALKKRNIKNIVDLGCGDGGLISVITSKHSKKMIGVDISPRRITSLKDRFPSHTFVCADVTKTGIKSNSIDLAISSQVIEHLEDRDSFLNETKRMVKKGGLFYISSVIKKPGAMYKYRNKGKFVLDPTHVYEYASKDEFLDELKKNGFTIIESKVEKVKRNIRGKPMTIPGFYIVEALCKK